MKRIVRRAASLALSTALVLSLAGCGHQSNTFTWQVENTPDNLDPQLAASSENRIAVTHLYSGLFRLGPDGEVHNACAREYTVSPDGRTYTFILQEGMTYSTTKGKSTDYQVTAEDFVFGLRRTFLPETRSPYAAELSNIEGSRAVLNGGDPDKLGVRALDEHTLEIRLSSPDDDFLRKLCLPGAMPCDEQFFTETSGAYGLTKENTITNGSFYLYSWTGSGLFLRREPSGDLVDNLRLVLAGEDEDKDKTPPSPAQLVADGKCHAAVADGSMDPAAEGLTRLPYTATTWTLVFNTQQAPFSSRALRAAMAQVAWDTPLTLPAGCTPADGLLPPQMGLGSTSLPDLGDPAQLFHLGLEESGLSNLTGMSILVPEGAGQLFSPLNQEWQKQLQAFFSVKEFPLDTLRRWVDGTMPLGDIRRMEQQHGQWAVALLPVTSVSADPASMLRQFDDGLGGWSDSTYHAGLDAMLKMPSGAARTRSARQLERILLEQCPAVPLFFQSGALLVDPSVSGLVFDPFGPLLDLTFAVKK